MLKRSLILCMAICFVACGSDDNDSETATAGAAGEGGEAGATAGAAGEGGEAGATAGAAGEGGEAGATAGPGCPDEGDAERVAAACAWLADCAVNSGLCEAYTEGDTESVTAVEEGCVAAASAALTNLACVHTSCDQTIGLANSANEDFANACAGTGAGGEAGATGGAAGEGGDAGATGGAAGGSSDECGTIHTVTTTDDTTDIDVYMDFTPEDLTISVGDCVNFELSATHNAIEVSQATYESRGTDALEGGFSLGFGATEQIKFDEAGTHYYICLPHVRMDMVGTITVQ